MLSLRSQIWETHLCFVSRAALVNFLLQRKHMYLARTEFETSSSCQAVIAGRTVELHSPPSAQVISQRHLAAEAMLVSSNDLSMWYFRQLDIPWKLEKLRVTSSFPAHIANAGWLVRNQSEKTILDFLTLNSWPTISRWATKQHESKLREFPTHNSSHLQYDTARERLSCLHFWKSYERLTFIFSHTAGHLPWIVAASRPHHNTLLPSACINVMTPSPWPMSVRFYRFVSHRYLWSKPMRHRLHRSEVDSERFLSRHEV